MSVEAPPSKRARAAASLSEQEQRAAVVDLQEMIRFETVSNCAPDSGAYDQCADWLLETMRAMGLHAHILPESEPHKPVVVGTWMGQDPSLPCLLLNSHVDVVPAMTEHWTVPPFAALERDGRVYGRGAQDMKCVCVQYLVALRKLKASGFAPLRTIHLSFVPDEEIGGAGVKVLMGSQFFGSMKIGLAFDEGIADESDSFSLFYGERLPWWVNIRAEGSTGHGSRFIECTAVEQAVGVVNRALAFRSEQKDALFGKGKHAGCAHAVAKTLGDVTSLNVTKLNAGVLSNGVYVSNVVPASAEVGLDIRISPHVPPADIKAMLDGWCKECVLDGGSLSWSWSLEHGLMAHSTTSTDGAVNPWWSKVTSVLEGQVGIKCVPSVFPGATDSRFLRAMGVRAIGFSPMRNSPILLHEHDEYIATSVFLEGCHVYVALLEELAMQSKFEGFDDTF